MQYNGFITEAKAKKIREEARFKGIFSKGEMFGRHIAVSSPVLHGNEQVFIEKALASGLDGSIVSSLETEIAKYEKVPFAAALSSGTAAVHMAVRLAAERVYGSMSGVSSPNGQGRGGCLYGKHVFCPDFADTYIADVVVGEGGTPVFIDASPDDWSMDPVVLEMAFQIYPDVKIVLMNHAYGFPGQIVEVKRICEAHGAILIEDASESFGASCFSSMTGTIGDFGILDFAKDKIITGASGGMLLTKDQNSHQKAKSLAAGGMAKAPWQQHEDVGCDGIMGDLAAAMILAQMEHIGEHINKKREIYDRYADAFEESMLLEMNPFPDGAEPNYLISCAACESGIEFEETRSDRGYLYTDQHGTAAPMEIIDALFAFGAESRPVYKPMSMQPVFGNCEVITLDGSRRSRVFSFTNSLWESESFSRDLFEKTICLPSDIRMTAEEQETIIEIVHSCFDKKNLDRMDWVAVEQLAKTS